MKVYVVKEEFAFDGDSGCNVAVWGDRKSAVEDFLKSEKKAKKEVGDGAVCELALRKDIRDTKCEFLSSSVYEDGFYGEAHFDVTMQRVEIGGHLELDPFEKTRFNEEYELECMEEDVMGFLSERKIKLSKQDVSDIARQAHNYLSKNDSYFEAYWNAVGYTIDSYLKSKKEEEE